MLPCLEVYVHMCMYIIIDNGIIYYTALFKDWKEQLGNFMIDYSTLRIEKVIAKG